MRFVLRWKVNGCFLVTARSSGYLQSEQIIHCADDDVDGGGAANLSPQVVLKIYSPASVQRMFDGLQFFFFFFHQFNTRLTIIVSFTQ